jgi:hypothetical protein
MPFKKHFSRKPRKYKRKPKTRRHRKKGGTPSPGLTSLGYPWDGGNVNTWPGVLSAPNGITKSNHFRLSPYGIPVGGVKIARSTSGDQTGNSVAPVPVQGYDLTGGYTYPGSAKKRRSARKSPRRSVKKGGKRKNKTKGKKKVYVGGFFTDIRNLARSIQNSMENRVNNVQGVPENVGVFPTEQPGISDNRMVFVSDPIDVEQTYRDMSESVAKI